MKHLRLLKINAFALRTGFPEIDLRRTALRTAVNRIENFPLQPPPFGKFTQQEQTVVLVAGKKVLHFRIMEIAFGITGFERRILYRLQEFLNTFPGDALKPERGIGIAFFRNVQLIENPVKILAIQPA